MADVRNIGFSFDVGGLPEGMAVFQQVLEQALPEVVFDVATKVRATGESKTPFSDKGEDAYHMKDHWSPVFTPFSSSKGAVTTVVTSENPTPYGPMLEFGLYPASWIHPGGKLTATQGGVFSTQAPGGILTPIIQDNTLEDYAVNTLQTLIDQLTGA